MADWEVNTKHEFTADGEEECPSLEQQRSPPGGPAGRGRMGRRGTASDHKLWKKFHSRISTAAKRYDFLRRQLAKTRQGFSYQGFLPLPRKKGLVLKGCFTLLNPKERSSSGFWRPCVPVRTQWPSPTASSGSGRHPTPPGAPRAARLQYIKETHSLNKRLLKTDRLAGTVLGISNTEISERWPLSPAGQDTKDRMGRR